ncbi:hypothetical protein TNCV_5119781 [Trichonephila clavipes]|nr:hypothetical protein TNCV_5119781 [Trichonephila clavipes]
MRKLQYVNFFGDGDFKEYDTVTDIYDILAPLVGLCPPKGRAPQFEKHCDQHLLEKRLPNECFNGILWKFIPIDVSLSTLRLGGYMAE